MVDNILLVDGYNIIGDWPELKLLKKTSFEEARVQLIEKMAEYQAYSGMKVCVIFDAHMVPGVGKKYNNYRLEIIYTKENETADERIEKLVKQLKNINTQVYVATSDSVEQSVTFGYGALRMSARELRTEMGVIEKGIAQEMKMSKNQKRALKIPIPDEMAEIFEKWRRGDM